MIIVNEIRIPEHGLKAVVNHRCDGCALCVDVCPEECLSIQANPKRPGKRVVVIGPGCVGCGACQGTCPKEGIAIPGLAPKDIKRLVRLAISEMEQQPGS